VALFNILYCGGEDQIKYSLLYDLMINSDIFKPLNPNDEELLIKIEILIMIPTLLIANIIE
jgi:hypothetical protein